MPEYDEEMCKNMRKLYESGMSLRAIAAQHYPGVPATTIRRCIIRVGGTMRAQGDYGGPRYVLNPGGAMASKLRALLGRKIYFFLATDNASTSMLGRSGSPLVEVGKDYLVVRYGTNPGTDYIIQLTQVVAVWGDPE